MTILRPFVLIPLAATALLLGQEEPTPTPPPLLPMIAPSPTPRGKGESLADSVRRSHASVTPAPKKKSLGSITNESIKKTGEGTGKGTLQMGPAHPIAPLPPVIAPATGSTTPEASWQIRATQARQRVERADADVKRLETETRRLENDFYAWSDGTYRDGVIKPAWDQAKEDLRKARLELDAAQNAVTDLEEEARKAGVPAGWLREPSPR